MAVPCKKRLVQTTLFIDRSFIMKCIWRIHGSKPYIDRWSLVYNTSVFCFSHFHLEGVGGLSEPNETNFIWKKLSHFATIPKFIWIKFWNQYTNFTSTGRFDWDDLIFHLQKGFTVELYLKLCRSYNIDTIKSGFMRNWVKGT